MMPGVISGGYISPEKVQKAREKEEQKRQAYGEAYAKKVIEKYPSLASYYDYYVNEGKLRWSRKMYAPSRNEDYTATFEYLDEKIQPSFNTYLEEMWAEETVEDEHGNLHPKPLHTIQEEPAEHHRSRPMRPYVGCPDCPRWNGWKCTKQFENTRLCEEIEERYKEKGE